MKKNTLFVLWGAGYLLCVLLGFIPQPVGALRVLLSLCSLAFFVPGFLLLYHSLQEGDRKTRKTIRLISAASLALTLLALVGNFLSVLASALVGNLLYVVLLFVSAPMVASGYWVASIFLWACLFIGSFLKGKR